MAVAENRGCARPNTRPSSGSCSLRVPNMKLGCVISSTPLKHSGMTTAVAALICSFRTTGESSATTRGPRNVNVVASAMGMFWQAKK